MDLKHFMENHVFAVWDFQCLVKSIKYLSGHDSPYMWMPPKIKYKSLRLINEIILDEETDVLPNGDYASHLDMYRMAMKEVGADTTAIDKFVRKYSDNSFLDINLQDVPSPAKEFVRVTLQAIGTRKLHIILSVFTHGRELIIPDMFVKILDDLELDAPMFRYYLNRHIELDGDEHGPAALELLEQIIDGDEEKRKEVEEWKAKALDARNTLWSELNASTNRTL
jgi:hypothetical protein